MGGLLVRAGSHAHRSGRRLSSARPWPLSAVGARLQSPRRTSPSGKHPWRSFSRPAIRPWLRRVNEPQRTPTRTHRVARRACNRDRFLPPSPGSLNHPRCDWAAAPRNVSAGRALDMREGRLTQAFRVSEVLDRGPQARQTQVRPFAFAVPNPAPTRQKADLFLALRSHDSRDDQTACSLRRILPACVWVAEALARRW